jgi:hypothetical protein
MAASGRSRSLTAGHPTIRALTEPVDCIVLGRNLAEGFIPHWAAQPEGEDQSSVDKINNTHKVVISNTSPSRRGTTPSSPAATSPRP